MRILITAIGSMSACCAIKTLKDNGHFVAGCNIYPKEWNYESSLCDLFFMAPPAVNEDEYIAFLMRVCLQERLECIIPLTDIEVDVIDKNRSLFESSGIKLCMQSSHTNLIARNKYKLYKFFENDSIVTMAQTVLLSEMPPFWKFPTVAKPSCGRSSEGLLKKATKEQVMAIENKEQYILQEYLEGDIFTVDYCRCAASGEDAAVARRELLRTKNGAGITVQMCHNPQLEEITSHIGKSLEVNGSVCMEFIHSGDKFCLIDFNPRFSAGIAFTKIAGYDMVTNHLRCFLGQDIDKPVAVREKILIKKYEEVTTFQ